MKFKSYPIQVWFLDEDLNKSALMLSDKYLSKTIDGCMNALISARFYFIGIRNKKFYNYYFSKQRRQETMDRFFPLWNYRKNPSFSKYQSKISKWTRMCREHYNLIFKYLEILLNEYEFRKIKLHPVSFFFDWEKIDAPKLNIPEAHLKKISFEWKSLNPKFRNKNICLGYRNQYKSLIQNDGLKISDYSKRDIPKFLIEEEIKENSNFGKFMM